MGRPSNKDKRRQQIVEALLAVIATQGYEKASIRSIAYQAGLNQGLVHYHFKNKQEILIELIRWIQNTAKQRYQSRANQASSAIAKLDSFIDAALSVDNEPNPQMVAAWVVVGAEAIRQKEVKVAYQQAVENHIIELKKLLIAAAEERNLNINLNRITDLACTIYGAIEGAFKLACSTDNLLPEGYAATTLKQMIYQGLSAHSVHT